MLSSKTIYIVVEVTEQSIIPEAARSHGCSISIASLSGNRVNGNIPSPTSDIPSIEINLEAICDSAWAYCLYCNANSPPQDNADFNSFLEAI